jgi:hypothetical protein
LVRRSIPEKPEIAFFSVPVKNTFKYRSVCQNKGEMHLAQSPPKALESRWFSPLSLAHVDPGNLPERECEGYFFPIRISKIGDIGKRTENQKVYSYDIRGQYPE